MACRPETHGKEGIYVSANPEISTTRRCDYDSVGMQAGQGRINPCDSAMSMRRQTSPSAQTRSLKHPETKQRIRWAPGPGSSHPEFLATPNSVPLGLCRRLRLPWDDCALKFAIAVPHPIYAPNRFRCACRKWPRAKLLVAHTISGRFLSNSLRSLAAVHKGPCVAKRLSLGRLCTAGSPAPRATVGIQRSVVHISGCGIVEHPVWASASWKLLFGG